MCYPQSSVCGLHPVVSSLSVVVSLCGQQWCYCAALSPQFVACTLCSAVSLWSAVSVVSNGGVCCPQSSVCGLHPVFSCLSVVSSLFVVSIGVVCCPQSSVCGLHHVFSSLSVVSNDGVCCPQSPVCGLHPVFSSLCGQQWCCVLPSVSSLCQHHV